MESKRKKILRKLYLPLRLVIINDETFEEKFSFKLTPMNVFVGLSSFIVIFGLAIFLLIYSTHISGFLPNFNDTNTKEELQDLMFKTDSLEKTISNRDIFLKNKLDILNGGVGLSDSVQK